MGGQLALMGIGPAVPAPFLLHPLANTISHIDQVSSRTMGDTPLEPLVQFGDQSGLTCWMGDMQEPGQIRALISDSK